MIKAQGVPNGALAVNPTKPNIINVMRDAALWMAFAIYRAGGGFRAAVVVFSQSYARVDLPVSRA
jgi:hypothetical protein